MPRLSGFKPDKVWSYELGEKFRDSDGRITINSAGYFENWQHIQQNVPLLCGFPFTEQRGRRAHLRHGTRDQRRAWYPGSSPR